LIETVVALLMFVGGEIKEARIQDSMGMCLSGKRKAERQYSETVSYKCWKGKAELEENIDGSLSIKKLILE
jgi:hypothetical protein